MKKFIFYILLVINTIACSNINTIDISQDVAITFDNLFVENIARADNPTITTSNLDKFYVWAFMDNRTGVVFDDEQVTKYPDGWKYTNTQYWTEHHDYYFYAIAGNRDNTVINTPDKTDYNTKGLGTITFTNIDGTDDLLYAEATYSTETQIPTSVHLQFDHLLSKVKLTFTNGFVNPDNHVAIKNIRIVVPQSASIDLTKSSYEWREHNGVTTIEMGDIANGAKLAIGLAASSDNERMTIPISGDIPFTILFDTELYINNVLATSANKQVNISDCDLLPGCAYSFKATINEQNIDNSPLSPIEFKVEQVENWIEAEDNLSSSSVATEAELEAALTNGKHVILSNDIVLSKGLIVKKDTSIDLNGYSISAKNVKDTLISITNNAQLTINGNNGTIESDSPIISVKEGACAINGGVYTSLTSNVGTKSEPSFAIYVKGNSHLQISEATLLAKDDNGGFVGAIYVDKGSSFSGDNAQITSISKTGITNSITSYGEVILSDCRIIALADHTANAAVTDYATTSRPLLIEDGTATLNNCYTYGMHSGGVIKGDVYINGGQYNGYSHGGLYISNGGKTTKIKNAVIQEVPLAEGYIDDGKAGTNHAGIYIGGSKNMVIYMDNCLFFGMQQPIVMKDNAGDGNNKLFISRSSINLDYTHYGVRNDGSSHITFGIGNNFSESNLKYKRNYTHSEEIYTAE